MNDFKDCNELYFKLFGDGVKNWFTVNEPSIFAIYGHEVGIAQPRKCSLQDDPCVFGPEEKYFVPIGPCKFSAKPVTFSSYISNSSTKPYIVAHNQILAHATTTKLYQEEYQAKYKVEIGIVLVLELQEDRVAAERLFDFNLGWLWNHLCMEIINEYERVGKRKTTYIFSTREKFDKGKSRFCWNRSVTTHHIMLDRGPPFNELQYSYDVSAENR
ncbi:putative vicianin beta-glucosidase [Rosa chinensis]|uniref:Putative vicianin beta-glucosidase n=1 Tax=Rosa chinensis TaxID=74649 RepID=A0A2P6P879_ROSCH|nr:putative vicianin beta-glucosidase [Rosa chinensis]